MSEAEEEVARGEVFHGESYEPETITREAETSLKPCPHCGEEPIITSYAEGGGTSYRVECECDVQGLQTHALDAIALWNARRIAPDITPTTAEVDEVAMREKARQLVASLPKNANVHFGALTEAITKALVSAVQSKLATKQPDITRLAREAAEKIAKSGAFRFDVVNKEAYREADLTMVAAIIERIFTDGRTVTQLMCDQEAMMTHEKQIAQLAFARGYEGAREDSAQVADLYPIEHRDSRRHKGEIVPDGLATKAGIASAIRSLPPKVEEEGGYAK